jgi:hypothetical protein
VEVQLPLRARCWFALVRLVSWGAVGGASGEVEAASRLEVDLRILSELRELEGEEVLGGQEVQDAAGLEEEAAGES